MSVSPKLFFNLNDNCTLHELKIARNNKINSLVKLNISDIEKQAYVEQIQRMYKKAKHLCVDYHNNYLNQNQIIDPFNFSNQIQSNINNMMHSFANLNMNHSNMNVNSIAQSKSVRQKVNPDGSTVVVEITKSNNNGQQEQTIYAYKKMPNGSLINLDPEQALEELGTNSNNNLLN